MSDATLQVRFPDGEVRFGIYNGTADIAQPHLHATPEEAWAARRTFRWPENLREMDADAVDVEVACNYGDGFSWPGVRATRDWITVGHSSFEADDGTPLPWTDGLPDWWVEG